MSNDKKNNELKELFIEDLGQVTGGCRRPHPTPVGEGPATTLALGEEEPTTLSLQAEEPTTLSLQAEEPTTLSLSAED
ncbi:hypothetical protein PPSIR1_03888 [Plesiocystis pacifica SIR-1]|uniref:Uncharacterized protein n=1 Tax=Plesiocystis pacifica SIR-1 TaxID=391625 RepID=A6G4D6_9BACT|nr:hypothetical protein [Plesiocystis pacifica]EDM79248.1 hypothetical protein PPSIR1_03888 [Plesiocystis pacifica SIR-1]